MNTTVVFAHPWENSLNKAILDRAVAALERRGDDVTVIDLYADGFDPVMSREDLALYGQGKSADPMVDKYNAILDKTEALVFLFPIWWYDMPAILRGFFDKVMLSGSAYTEDAAGMHPVRNVKHTLLFTTSAAPTDALVQDFGDPVNGTIIRGTFNAIGFFNAQWYNLGGINTVTPQQVKRHLDAVDAALG